MIGSVCSVRSIFDRALGRRDGAFPPEPRSRRRGLQALPALVLFFLSSAVLAGTAHYRSPDGSLEASVITHERENGSGESVVVIKNRKDKTLSTRNHTSPDGQHGHGVESAAWSGDSQFFIYSTSSSGGHQAGRFPIFFYSRRDGRTRPLEEYVGAIVSPQFQLYMPDIVVVRVEDANGEQERLKIPMHKLKSRR